MLEVILSKKIVQAAIIIVAFSITYIVINKIIRNLMKVKLSHLDVRRNKTVVGLISNLIKYVLLILAILMVLGVYGVDTSALVTSLGAVGVVAGLAIQDTLKDFFAGIMIIIENQYAIGDTVTIGGFEGEVIGLGMKSTKIKATTGEVCFIPNRTITNVVNHSINSVLAIVKVQISNKDNVNEVEKILTKTIDKLTKKLTDLKGEITLQKREDIKTKKIEFKITAKTSKEQLESIQKQIQKEIKIELGKNDIRISNNQVVIQND